MVGGRWCRLLIKVGIEATDLLVTIVIGCFIFSGNRCHSRSSCRCWTTLSQIGSLFGSSSLLGGSLESRPWSYLILENEWKSDKNSAFYILTVYLSLERRSGACVEADAGGAVVVVPYRCVFRTVCLKLVLWFVSVATGLKVVTGTAVVSSSLMLTSPRSLTIEYSVFVFWLSGSTEYDDESFSIIGASVGGFLLMTG